MAILRAFVGTGDGTESSSSGLGKGKAIDKSRSGEEIFASPKLL
jgi:hypothetical protein